MGQDFRVHLDKTIQIFTHLQNGLRSPEDDQLASYLLSAWARLAQVMQADFTPFLHLVMPNLLRVAKTEAQVTVLDGKLFRHINLERKKEIKKDRSLKLTGFLFWPVINIPKPK